MLTQRRKSSTSRASCASSNGIGYQPLSSHTLIRPAGERVAFTSRMGGGGRFHGLNLSLDVGDEPAEVMRSRKMVSAAVGIGQKWLTVRQVHGAHVHVAVDLDAPEGIPIEADAIIAGPGHLPIAVMVADCAPVAVVSGDHRMVIHVGWRGLAAGVVERAAHRLSQISIAPARAWIGPCIGACHFEVGPEVAEAFRTTHPGSPSFQTSRDGKTFFDLLGAVRWCLSESGFEVDDSGWACTFCDQRFFSHRSEGLTGRQAVIVW